MTREQIREAIIEMDCLSAMEADVLAGEMYNAIEKNTEEDRQRVLAIIDWLNMTDRIYFKNYLDLRDLIF